MKLEMIKLKNQNENMKVSINKDYFLYKQQIIINKQNNELQSYLLNIML